VWFFNGTTNFCILFCIVHFLLCACDLHRSDLRSGSCSQGLSFLAPRKLLFVFTRVHRLLQDSIFLWPVHPRRWFFFSKLDFRCRRSSLAGVPAQAKSALVAHRFFLKGSALDFAAPICLGVVLAPVLCLGLGSVFVFRALDLFFLSVSTDILAPDLCAEVIFLIQLMLGFFHSRSRVGQFSALR
jgi:hypothetical protein